MPNHILALASLASILALAQDPGSNATGSQRSEPQVSAPNQDTTTEARTARQMARDWISQKGWSRGDNGDGSVVAIGTASYSAGATGSALARSNAFQLAALRAKNELAEFLSKRIATQVAGLMAEGSIPAGSSGAPKDVVEQLAEEVKASGQSAKEVLNSTDFASAVFTRARAEVAGTTVSNSFESETPAGDGALAVVIRFTETSRALAAAAMGLGPAPTSEKVVDAKAWAKEMSESTLYSSFGARLFRTGKDEVCVVAFGLADVNGKSDNAFDVAAEKAKAAADGELRMFVGEMIASQAILSRRSSFKETADAGIQYRDAEGFRKTVVARAAELALPGSKPIRDWEGAPAGKKPVAGVAMMWSVTSSDTANALRRRFEQVGASGGGEGRMNSSPESSPTDRKLPPVKKGSSGPETPEP